MSTTLIVILVAIFFVGFFVIGMSLTLIFKGHNIRSEISENKRMQEQGIKCAVQETRELDAQRSGKKLDCAPDTLCSGNCNVCDGHIS